MIRPLTAAPGGAIMVVRPEMFRRVAIAVYAPKDRDLSLFE
jgi:hypothetical protein